MIDYRQMNIKYLFSGGERATDVRIVDMLFQEVWDDCCYPENLETELEGATRSIVMMDMAPPLLAIEVVSPKQENRNYRYKRTEYAARGMAEYWIVDPLAQKITILEWIEGLYEEKIYMGDSKIESSIFKNLELTVDRLLQAH
jgi:Uma2 family endonuclease